MESQKQTIIIPKKGICNTLPDQISHDTELYDALNLIYDDDAVKPIQCPQMVTSIKEKLLYVHQLNSGDVYYIFDKGNSFDYYKHVGDNLLFIGSRTIEGGIIQVTAVGNTLIVNTLSGIEYFLFKNGGYTALGKKIPTQQFYAELYMGTIYNGWGMSDPLNTNGIVNQPGSGVASPMNIVNTDSYRDLVIALFNNVDNKHKENKRFTQPFFVVSAVELYDGSYTMMSAPVLLYPSITDNGYANHSGDSMTYYSFGAYLRCQQLYDYTDWSDIVKGVTVFVSEQIPLYDTLSSTLTYDRMSSDDTILNGIFHYAEKGQLDFGYQELTISTVNTSDTKPDVFRRILAKRSEEEIKKDIVSTSAFFKLCDLGRSTFGVNGYQDVSHLFTKFDLLNLTSATRLNKLEYFSHTQLRTSKQMFTFNRRLNLIAPQRNFFEGFDQFMPYYNEPSKKTYNFKVTISTPDGFKHAYKTVETQDIISTKSWLYYPDPRATSINVNGTDFPLTEHKGLNGAYYFGGLPTGDEKVVAGIGETGANTDTEVLQNFIVQSDVDNPFYFPAEGYTRVGQGEILSMAGLTTALSQDAYKVSTTIVFTTQGVWALTVNSDGRYSSVAPPFSREVCNNPSSVTMIDNGVLFSSDKGLMLIDDNGIRCVSTNLDGKLISKEIHDTLFGEDTDRPNMNFKEFLLEAILAYDYKNSHVWIINENYSFSWIYSLKTGTFSRYADTRRYDNICANYPDTLLQDSQGLYSLRGIADINNDTNGYSGHLVTRPLKFDESIRLKSLRDLQHIDTDTGVSLQIYASNDCKTWGLINSLGGRGFRYFIFKYSFTNIKATDSYAGTLVGYNIKQPNKIRSSNTQD